MRTAQKAVQAYALSNGPKIISEIEKTGKSVLQIAGIEIVLEPEDVEIIPVDMPGWKVANSGSGDSGPRHQHFRNA